MGENNSVATYDPGQVIVLVNAVPLSGFSDDGMIEAEREEDTFIKKVGVDGFTSRARNRNKSGEITITLQQTSPSNDHLSALAILDEQTGRGVVPVLIKDLSGRSVLASAFAWVRKPPASAFAKEVEDREWILDCASLDIFTGGNTIAS